MKTSVLILALVFISLSVSAQPYRDISLQTDSVYKANKVRTRISTHPGAPSRSEEIYVFDKDGRPLALIMTDNATGDIPQDVTRYSYNGKGVLSAETDTLYRGGQYAVEVSELFYGPDGSLARQVVKNDGRLHEEKYFYAAENKETDKYYRDDTVYREENTTYDTHGVQVRFWGKEMANTQAQPHVITANGKSYTFPAANTDMVWDYTYVNNYDSSGNLILQERYDGGKLKGRTNFVLDKLGLLTRLNDSAYTYTYY